MNDQVAPGRIRWAVPGPALAASALLPGVAEARAQRVDAIVQVEAGRSVAAGKAAARARGGHGHGRPAGHQRVRREAGRRRCRRAPGRPRHQGLENAVAPQDVDLSRLRTAYPASVDAPQVWNNPFSDVTGKGVGVAVVDTGIAGGMPDFRATGSSSSRVIASAVTNPDARTPGDAYGRTGAARAGPPA